MKEDAMLRFDRRAFASLMVAVTAALLPGSGLANHLLQSVPPWTTSRHAWMAVHTSLGVLFTAFAAWHVVLNRRALLAHLQRPAASGTPVRRETFWAIALVAATSALAAGHALLVR